MTNPTITRFEMPAETMEHMGIKATREAFNQFTHDVYFESHTVTNGRMECYYDYENDVFVVVEIER